MSCPTRTRSALAVLSAALVSSAISSVAYAAELPPHPALRILIVSDEVNPYGLSNAELTQPGDISVALQVPGSGLNIDAVLEIATDDLATATAALLVPFADPAAYDVLIYFAHRIPNGAGAAQAQAEFVAAVEGFLVAGGGVVSFHHGSFQATGKTAMLDLIGGVATANSWQPIAGQRLINVAPGHFVTTQSVKYTSSLAYADPGRGVAAGNYDAFDNIPDERYPVFDLVPSAEQVEILFASDYNEGGSATHLLGFTHQRTGWLGRVVAYQPGEYQPQALDDPNGNNFQILANAILYSAGLEGPVGIPALGGIELTALAAVVVLAALFLLRPGQPILRVLWLQTRRLRLHARSGR